MKNSLVGISAAVLSLVVPVLAAPPMGGPSPATEPMDHLSKIYREQSFEARVEMTMTATASSRNAMPGPMEYFMVVSKGKTRVEMDMGKMVAAAGGSHAAAMPPGFDKVINIMRPDKKMAYMIYPGLQSYCEMPIPEPKGEKSEVPKVDRKVEGIEKVSTYTCEKVRNSFTMPDGTSSPMRTGVRARLRSFSSIPMARLLAP